MSLNGGSPEPHASPDTRDTDPPADPVGEIRGELHAVRSDVTSLRGEVQRGFSAVETSISTLRAHDDAQDASLAALAKKVSVPVIAVTVLLEGIRIVLGWLH